MITKILSAGIILMVILGGGNKMPALALFCALAAIALWITIDRGYLKKNLLTLPSSLFIAVSALSLAANAQRGVNGFIAFSVMVLSFALLYVFSSAEPEDYFPVVSSVIILLSSFLGVELTLQGIFMRGFFTSAEFLPLANFPNYNLASGFIISGLIVSVSSLLFNKDLRSNANPWSLSEKFLKNKILLIGCSLPMVSGLLFAFSRGAWFALIFSITALLLIKSRKMTAILYIIPGLITLLAFLFLLLPGPYLARWFSHKFLTEESSTRLVIWRASAEAFLAEPVCGWGPGNFQYAYYGHKKPYFSGITRYGKYTRFAHNEYLHSAVELGLPGLAVFAWLIFLPLKISFLRARDSLAAGRADSWRYAASAAALLAISLHAFFDFNLHFPAIIFLFVFFAGYSCTDSAENPVKTEFTRLLRPLCFLTLLACAAVTASQAFAVRGDSLKAAGRDRSAERAYRAAVSFNPSDVLLWRKTAYLSRGVERLTLLKDALFFNPSDSFLHQDIARAYLGIHEPNRAFDEYLAAAGLNPKNPFFYAEAAEAFRLRGLKNDALYYYGKACKIEPFFAAARVRQGQILFSQGMKGRAVEEFRKALKSEKTFRQNPGDGYTRLLVTINYGALRRELNGLKK
jgi:O-antigen ligase